MGTADIKNYIIGIIIFTIFITGGIHLISTFAEEDDTFLDDEKYTQFNSTFNKRTELHTSIDNLEGTVVNADTDFGVFGVLNSLISTAWNSLKLIGSSFSFMTTIIGGIYTFFGIPIWVGSLILSIITIVIIFAIWEAIFQR